MKLRLLAAVLGTLFIASGANAGLLIDPYIGIGSTKSTLDLATKQDETSTSNAVGARLGYSFILLSGGIDYQMLSAKDSADKDIQMTNTSAFVGVDLPILLRFWGEYFFNSTSDSDTDLTFKDGYGLGVGFTGLPFVSINLEVETLNYDARVSGTDFDYSTASTILSVSLPLDF